MAAATAAQDKAQEWWARAKTAVGLEQEVEEEPANASLLDSFNEATTLNKTQVGTLAMVKTRCALHAAACCTALMISSVMCCACQMTE